MVTLQEAPQDLPPNVGAVFGTHDANTLRQLRDVASRAVRVALMSDGHMGYVMPIGGVAAYRNQISVVGVGFDIACGNAAIRTNLNVNDLGDRDWNQIADEITRSISFGVGRRNNHDDPELLNHPLFDDPAWDALPREANVANLKGKARSQLGTVGSGNHYVDVFYDEQGTIWVGCHFGSRGLGHTIATGFLRLGHGKGWNERVPEQETILDLSTPLGDGYWALMNLAGQYAYAGREWVVRKVVNRILGGTEEELIHNHHNFAWSERHFGEDLIVVRKGATPAFPGQKGFVGGSMGDQSVILRGWNAFFHTKRTPDEAAAEQLQFSAMFSTVHGAGRVMSRTAAAGKSKGWGKRKKRIAPGLVSQEMMDAWLKEKGVIRRGGGVDESPHVYRRLPEVLAAQGPTIEVLHTLTPIVVVMADEREVDPYAD